MEVKMGAGSSFALRIHWGWGRGSGRASWMLRNNFLLLGTHSAMGMQRGRFWVENFCLRKIIFLRYFFQRRTFWGKHGREFLRVELVTLEKLKCIVYMGKSRPPFFLSYLSCFLNASLSHSFLHGLL